MRYIFLKCVIIFIVFSSADSPAYNYRLPVEKYKLPNGLTVILEEDNTSRLVTIQLWIRTGSCYEGKFLGAGITHLVEHMVFKGERARVSTRIAKELQKLGGELDASTSKEYTNFSITIDKENLEKTMEIVYSVIAKAGFMQEELDKEKQVIIREMDTIEDDPNRLLAEEFFKLSFQGHPYGEPVIGRKELFQRIDRKDLIEYYKSQYNPRNIVLVVVGDFSTASLKPLIEKFWGKIPDIFSEPNYIPYKPSAKGPTRGIFYKDVLSSYIIIGFYGPSIDSQDMYPMDVLAEIEGGGKESRLVKKLRDKLGIVSNINAWSYTPTCTGIWGVNADLIGSDWGLVLKNVLKEIYRLRLTPVTEEELSKAKKRILRKYLSGLETIDGRATELGSNEIYTRNPLFSTAYISGIRNVTAEDIRKVARRYFNTQNFTIAILTPHRRELVQKPIKVIEEVTKIKLDNGMKILIKEDHRLPLVTIRLAALGGLLEEDIPGLSYFFSQLWLKENEDLVKDIESVGGSISTYSGNNSLGLGIEVFNEDISLALEVIRDLIQEFPITARKMELVRKIQLAEIKQEEDIPYGYAFKLAKNTFFDKHPYRNSILGTEGTIVKIKEDNIRNFFSKYITPNNIVISIFGDIDAKDIRVRVLDVLNVRGPASHIGKEMRLQTPKVNKKIEHRKTEQAIIILAYPSTSIYSNDRYAIELLTQVFSGQAGRLYESIREKKGLSYSIGALNLIGREPGSFMFYIATNPRNKDNAVKFLFNEVSKIKKEGISDEELNRVKKYFITQVQENWESTSGLSLEVALDELYGLGWDYYKKYLEDIEKVTTGDIKTLANKYFRDDWYTLVVVGRVDE